MFLIDSHCHLDRFQDIERVLDRARAEGIGGYISISTSPATFSALKPIVQRHADVYGTVGLHPCDVENMPEEDVYPWLIQELEDPKIIGIGETGLDAQEKSPPMFLQERYFQHHIRAAVACRVPLVVHTRNSDDAFLSVMRDVRKNWPGGDGVKGVLHCFTGGIDCAKQVVDWGWKVSFSGIITFKNAPALKEVVRALPLSALLIETDAPWLAPHPYRGQPNEPAFMIKTAEMLAEIKQCSLEHIIGQTYENTLELFDRMPSQSRPSSPAEHPTTMM